MTRTNPVGVRLDADVKAALDAAAQADSRSTASLINKILKDWVLKNSPRP